MSAPDAQTCSTCGEPLRAGTFVWRASFRDHREAEMFHFRAWLRSVRRSWPRRRYLMGGTYCPGCGGVELDCTTLRGEPHGG